MYRYRRLVANDGPLQHRALLVRVRDASTKIWIACIGLRINMTVLLAQEARCL